MFKKDLLPLGKPIDPMAERAGVVDETHGVWTAREESRGSPFFANEYLSFAHLRSTGHQYGLGMRSGV